MACAPRMWCRQRTEDWPLGPPERDTGHLHNPGNLYARKEGATVARVGFPRSGAGYRAAW